MCSPQNGSHQIPHVFEDVVFVQVCIFDESVAFVGRRLPDLDDIASQTLQTVAFHHSLKP